MPPPLVRFHIAAMLTLAALTPVAYAGGLPTPKHQPSPEPIVVKVDGGSFRWGDAGIGAAAGFGAALVLSGSLALAGRRGRAAAHPQDKERIR